MAEPQNETGDITDRFKAFATSADPAPSRALSLGLVVAGVALVVVLVVTIVVLAR